MWVDKSIYNIYSLITVHQFDGQQNRYGQTLAVTTKPFSTEHTEHWKLLDISALFQFPDERLEETRWATLLYCIKHPTSDFFFCWLSLSLSLLVDKCNCGESTSSERGFHSSLHTPLSLCPSVLHCHGSPPSRALIGYVLDPPANLATR